jgi:hypothetical protein
MCDDLFNKDFIVYLTITITASSIVGVSIINAIELIDG